MKPHLLLLVISTLLIFSCDDDTSCEELDWLDSETQTMRESELSQYFYVSQAEYKFMTVFVFSNCCHVCNTTPPSVYTCSGDHIGYLGDDIDPDDLKNSTIFWKPDNFACTVQ